MTQCKRSAADGGLLASVGDTRTEAAKSPPGRKDGRPERRSESLLLPGEDARAFRRRLKAWTGTLGPRNAIELYLVERAAILSWQIDRAHRAEVARLTHEADRSRSDAAGSHEFPRARRLGCDDTEMGEHLRREQLACTRALSRMLEAFAGVRSICEAADGDIEVPRPQSVAAPKARRAANPDSSGVVAKAPVGEEKEEAGLLSSGSLAVALDAIFASEWSAGASLPAEPPAAVAIPDAAPGDTEDPHRSPTATRPLPRRRAAGTPDDRSGWSDSRDPARPVVGADRSSRSRPTRRIPQQPDDPTIPHTSRRRVGGYLVPLDDAVPISCADRIPVRLRRELRIPPTRRAAGPS